MPATQADQDKLPLSLKLSYGVGGTAQTIALYSISQYALLFYNQVLGLPPALAGLALTISLLIDGFIDPIVGSLSDRTRSKLGRRHPYMLIAPPFIALSYLAIFNPPGGLDQWTLFTWFAIAVSALRISMAFFETPMLALGGELSTNYVERSRVMAYLNFFIWAGGSLIVYVALTYFFHKTPEYPRGLLNPKAYMPFSLFAAASTMAILYLCALSTKGRIPKLPQAPANLPKFSPFEFLKDLGKIFSNRNYCWLLAAYFTLSLTTGIRGGLSTYMTTFFFGLTSEQIRYYIIGSFVGYLLAFLFAARLHGKYDKKAMMICSALASAIFPALPVVLRLSGFFFANGDPMLLPTLVVLAGAAFGAAAVLSITVLSALADIADENQVRYGVRQEGILYSTRALFTKIDTAIGALIAGFALEFVAFPAKAVPGHVDPNILLHLAIFESPIAAIPALVAVFFFAQYKINHETYLDTRRKIDAGLPLVEPIAPTTLSG